MKLALYVFASIGTLALACVMVTRIVRVPVDNPIAIIALSAFFVLHPIGAFWMMYRAIRDEKSPWPFILIAFMPWGSIWYHFDRVRPNRIQEGRSR